MPVNLDGLSEESDKFLKTAKALERDESERGFEEKLKRITKPQDKTS
jgi:hypothetical protein